MFCSKCGKEINYDSPICYECISAMANETQNQNVNAAEEAEAPVSIQQSLEAPVVEEPSNAAPVNNEVPLYAVPFAPMPVPQPRPQQQAPLTIPGGKSSRMEGFGGALTAVILSTVGFIMIYVALYAAVLGSAIGIIFGALLTLAPYIIALVLGIKSITTFVSVKRSGRPVPIATLIMGIEALATSAIMIMYMLLLGCVGAAACSQIYDDSYYGGSYI